MNEMPVRILHVVQRMEAAGVQSLLMNVYRKIDRSKVQFDFLVHYKEHQFFDDEIERLGGRIYRLTVREDKNMIKYLNDLKVFFLNHPEYKIIHGHMDSLGYFYLGAAKKAGIPIRIAHAHNVIKGGNAAKRLRNVLNRFYKTNATILMACSEDAGRYMFGGKKFTVLHNSIDVSEFAYNEQIRASMRRELNVENNFVIGNVGRLAYQKNQKFLFEIFHEILKMNGDARLILVGEGELYEELMDYANQLGIRNRLLYFRARNDVNKLYQAMDAFVFPSVFEGLGIVAIEAQTSGLLTFCSDAVPKEANVTSVYKKVPLIKSAEEWAKIITDTYNIRAPRKDLSRNVAAAGYDTKFLAKELQEFYLNAYDSLLNCFNRAKLANIKKYLSGGGYTPDLNGLSSHNYSRIYCEVAA